MLTKSDSNERRAQSLINFEILAEIHWRTFFYLLIAKFCSAELGYHDHGCNEVTAIPNKTFQNYLVPNGYNNT
jgi:hypothetical protein